MLGLAGSTWTVSNAQRSAHRQTVHKLCRRKIPLQTAQPKDELERRERRLLAGIDLQVKYGLLRKSSRDCAECGRNCVIVRIDGVEVDYCLFCRGMWFDPSELKHITKQKKDIPSDNCCSRVCSRKCPDCGRYMKEYVYRKPFWVLADRCPSCHGVYLQDRELEQVFKLLARVRNEEKRLHELMMGSNTSSGEH